MIQQSPNFKDVHRHSGSPVPLRSPSPDFMTKSAIVHTPLSLVEYKQKNTERLPLIEEVKYLREENHKLLQIASARGQLPQSSMNEVLKEKDRIIDNLKRQLKSAESRPGKGGLSLMGNSGHKHSPSENSGFDLRQENEDLRAKIKKLLEENQELKRKKSGSQLGQKHKPNIDIPLIPQNAEIQLSRSNLDKIKEQLGRQLLNSIDGMMSNFSLKLKDIEQRVSLIESKLNDGVRVPSGSKDPVSTIGNQSPYSGFGTGQKINKFDNYNTPPPNDRRDNLALKIQDLENQISRSKHSQHKLNNMIYEYQTSLKDKENEVEKLYDEIRKLKNQLRASQTLPPLAPNILSDSQAKNRLSEENISLKKTLTGLSAELSTIKNDKMGIERQNELLKKELEIERKNKTAPMGASQTDQHIIQSLNMKIENYENNSKQLVNETISLRDTLAELRKTNNQIVSELDEFKRQNYSLKNKLENMEKDKSDLQIRVRADSNAEIVSQTENMKLRLRINQLQEQAKDQQYYSSQIKNLNQQLNFSQVQIRQLKSKQFDLEQQNAGLRKEAQRAFSLSEQNDMLKRSINNFERANEQLLKCSDHTKNELIRINQEKVTYQNEIIQVKSTLRLTEGDLVTVRQRLSNLEKEYRKLEQQNNMNIIKINQNQSNLNNTIIERDNISAQYQQLSVKLRTLEFQYLKLKNDNQKQDLLNQVNILTTRLRESEHHLSNSKRLEEQRNNQLIQRNNELHHKNNELLLALTELSEVRKLLLEVNFDSVEGIVRQLQNKQKAIYEQKLQISRLNQQSSQQVSKLALENDRIKKQSLELSQRLYEQKQRADRFSASINQLESEKVALNERIARLEESIRQYISQDNVQNILSRTQIRQNVQASNYFDERISQRQLSDVQYMKQPIIKAVQKLDKAAEKISYVVGDGNRGSIMQTQSYVVNSSISSNVGDSRKR